jgi:hypothetical protein
VKKDVCFTQGIFFSNSIVVTLLATLCVARNSQHPLSPGFPYGSSQSAVSISKGSLSSRCVPIHGPSAPLITVFPRSCNTLHDRANNDESVSARSQPQIPSHLWPIKHPFGARLGIFKSFRHSKGLIYVLSLKLDNTRIYL